MRPPISKLRLFLAGAVAGLVFAGFCGGRPVRAEAPAPESRANPDAPLPAVAGVAKIGITVRDLSASRAFFESVLGFRGRALEPDTSALTAKAIGVGSVRAERVELELGAERVVLSAFVTPAGGRPAPRDTQGNDLWFQHIAIVVSDMDRAYAWLRKHRVTHVSSAPQTLPAWNRAAAGIRAFYFTDPDGHPLEIISFPKGKGDPRWQRRRPCVAEEPERCLFLGIDHTAITVSDTEKSLAFYRDALGLRVAGESENYGVEQEHLNGVFGAHLRITALRAASGPGIELLEYLAPRGGRPAPSDARPNDVANFQVEVRAPSTLGFQRAASRAGGRVLAEDAATKSALVRDPDGHALRVEGTEP